MAKRLGERLVEAGLITASAIDQALQHQKITGQKMGECLVDLKLVPEAALLRFLASELNTRFVSTDKLSKAKISSEVLDKVPVRLAEAQLFIPLVIDEDRRVLSIVSAEPQNQAALQEIALITGVDEVSAFVGLRSAIGAAIKKHYYGDTAAFATLESGGTLSRQDVASLANSTDQSRTDPRMAAMRFETDPRARLTRLTGTQVGAQPTMMRDALGLVRSTVGDNDFAETLNILVGLLEQSRTEMRGHSSQLGRQASLVARRLGQGPREIAHLTTAAYLHDLGKPPQKHFTVASNAADPSWKADAKRHWRAPVKLFETVRLAPAVSTILSQLYEAYDGSGVPQGSKGEEIAIGARILSAVDSYLDLMKNGSNALGRKLSRSEALTFLTQQSGRLFDPAVVDAISRLHSGELLRRRLENDGRQILIAEPEDSTRNELVAAVSKSGVVVQSLSSLEGAVESTLAGEVDTLVLGLRFGLPLLLGLIEAVRADPASASLPIVVLGAPTESMGQGQLERAGPTAVVSMPLEVKAVADTVLQLYRQRIAHGGPGQLVRGSFDELSQADLLKTLGAMKKSGRLTLRSDGREGYAQLERGHVVFASFGGQSGEAALESMLKLKQADFAFDPDSVLLELPQLDADMPRVLSQLERVQAA